MIAYEEREREREVTLSCRDMRSEDEEQGNC